MSRHFPKTEVDNSDYSSDNINYGLIETSTCSYLFFSSLIEFSIIPDELRI